MKNQKREEEKQRNKILAKATNELEKIYVLYYKINTLEKRSYWKEKWYKTLYDIKEV